MRIMEDKISVFGGTGFIGGTFCKMYETESILIPRDEYEPSTKNILYFISTTNNYHVFKEPHLDIETNLKVLIDVLQRCREKEDVMFNFVSSWFVYGKTSDLPATEDSPCVPKGFYSITKRAAEQLIISYCETFDIKYRIMRLCNVYGTADTKASKKQNALQYLITEVVNNRDINLYNGGQNIRDFMHVSDTCTALRHVIKYGHENEIINIGMGIPHRFIDIMSYVRRKVDSTSKFNFIEPPKFHKVVQVEDMYLKVNKLNDLGFKPRYTFWQGIDEIIEAVREESL